MILLWICVSVVIGISVKAYALPIVMRMVALRNWLYAALESEEGEEHCEEMMADIQDEIAYYRLNGDSNDSIAVKILIRLTQGMPSDIAGLAPFVPALLADRVTRWSNTLRNYRVPSAMVAGVATLGLMNYSFFSSSGNQTFGTWLYANGIVVATTILMWKSKHPIARRILYSWMGIAVVVVIGFMVWFTVQHRLYEIMTFKVLMLAMVAVLPAIIVVDKSWRNRLFGGRWWLIAVCWAPIIGGAFAGSLLIAQDVKPLLEMWAAMAVLAVGMFIVYGAIVLAAYVLCLLGIRGSAGGLRLAVSSIRHLR